MREHLRAALLETRNFLLKQKAGKYNEQEDEKKDDVPRMALKADSSSGSNGNPTEPESPREPDGDTEDFEKEKVEFFRKKRKPKVREAITGLGLKR